MITIPQRVRRNSSKFFTHNPFGEILGNTLLLSLIGLFNRSLTVVTQIVIASRFGTSLQADAYSATEIIPDLFIVLIGSGLSMAFIPHYDRFRTAANRSNRSKGIVQNQEQRNFASAFILSITLLFLGLTLLLFIGAPVVVSLLAPGFEGEARTTTISLFRIMVLTLAFLGPEAGLRGLFHTYKEFATPDLSRFVYNLILLLSVIFFSDRLSIQSVGIGMVGGAAIMIGIQMRRALQLGILEFKWRLYHPAITEILRKTPAILIVLAWPMLLLAIDRSISSSLDAGNIAALGYANRISMLPIGILVLPLITVLYPEFSAMANRANHTKMSEQIDAGLRMLIFIALPICVGIITSRHEIVRLLFERGQFDANATLLTSNVLIFYIIAVPGFAMVFFLRGIYLSIEKAWSLCLICLATWGCNIVLNLIFIRFWGVQGVTLATALIAIITPLLMLYNLKEKHHLPIRIKTLLVAIAQMCLFALAMMWVFDQIIQLGSKNWIELSTLRKLSLLAIGWLISLAFYLLSAWIFKVPEIRWVFNKLPFANLNKKEER